jgi:hypothetical protein
VKNKFERKSEKIRSQKKETKLKKRREITITSQNHHQLPQIIWFKENGRLVRQQQQEEQKCGRSFDGD